MLIKEFDPAQTTAHLVSPGDSLYFLRDKDDRAVRVEATVVRVLYFANSLCEDLSHTLKEMQPKLQLTEEQFTYWSSRKQVLLVELGSAQKIGVIPIAADKIAARSDWMAFEEFGLIVEEKGALEHPTFSPQSKHSRKER
jgi:hypothetical protein